MAKTSGNGTRGNGAQGTIAQRAANGINTLIARAKLTDNDFTEAEIKDLKKSAAAAIRADKNGQDTTRVLAGIDGFINRRAEDKPDYRRYAGVSASEAKEMESSSVEQLRKQRFIIQDNAKKAAASADGRYNGSTEREWNGAYLYINQVMTYKQRFKLK